MTNEKIKEIDLGGDFGAVALKVNGLRIEIGADGESVRVVSDTPTKIKFSVGTTPPKRPPLLPLPRVSSKLATA